MFFQGKPPANQSCKWTWQRTKHKLQAEVVAIALRHIFPSGQRCTGGRPVLRLTCLFLSNLSQHTSLTLEWHTDSLQTDAAHRKVSVRSCILFKMYSIKKSRSIFAKFGHPAFPVDRIAGFLTQQPFTTFHKLKLGCVYCTWKDLARVVQLMIYANATMGTLF
jgi:hypothetical protein